MKFVAANNVAPPEYFEGVADEFEAVADIIAQRFGAESQMAKDLKELAAQIRESTALLKVA